MKKCFLILILLAFAATGAFAFSIGGGGLFDWSFNNGIETEVGKDTEYAGIRNMSFGGFIFFEVKYIELDLSFTYGIITDVIDDAPGEPVGSWLQAGASLLLKYPLDFGRVTFSPLLGASYNAVFTEYTKYGKKTDASASDNMKELGQIGLLGGAGVDITLSGSLFLRIEALYQVRFASKVFNDLADFASSLGADSNATLGKGPRAKIGLGYKF